MHPRSPRSAPVDVASALLCDKIDSCYRLGWNLQIGAGMCAAQFHCCDSDRPIRPGRFGTFAFKGEVQMEIHRNTAFELKRTPFVS